MLFRQRFWEGLSNGTVTLAFRRWRRPSVRTGGTLLTPVGELAIEAVELISAEQISQEDAHRAGFATLEALLAELNVREEGELYRVEFGALRPDPRIALRDEMADEQTLAELRERLQRLDARSDAGPWTLKVLELLEAHPGVRAGDLCLELGQEKDAFKLNVRKLKNLGLTESLGTGYRLSPRGSALIATLRTA